MYDGPVSDIFMSGETPKGSVVFACAMVAVFVFYGLLALAFVAALFYSNSSLLTL